MRNPMQSSERVWACIVEMPVSVDDEGHTKYVYASFASKDVNDELHKLKCILKVCNDNFGIRLARCKPYAVITGKQKGNVIKAFDYVAKLLKKYI
jgi:hypothetical protein